MSVAAMATKVILTRPQGKNHVLADRLAQAGLPALSLPALHIEPLVQDRSMYPLPADFDLIIFVSGHACRFYLTEIQSCSGGLPWPAHTVAATVGVSSAQLLHEARQIPMAQILHPDANQAQDSETLWNLLQPRVKAMERALIVRGTSGREWLGQKLEGAGVDVQRLAVYERLPAHWTPPQADGLAKALTTGHRCVFLLTSSESVDAVYANISRLGLEDAWSQSRFVVIHERVASRLQSILKASGKVEPPVVKICQPSDDAIFQTITSMASLSEST